MSSASRDSSRDRELVLRHQPSSFSDSGRSSIPMWDSSDPERAPPPLPLNPGSPDKPLTKPNTSSNVAAAAEAIAARARENSYPTSPTKSPERSLIRGAHHRRLQSLQPATSPVKDLSSYVDNNRSPDRSPERPLRLPLDLDIKSPERPSTSAGTPTPLGRDINKDVPALRPSSRPGLKAILGETPPQSATMRALQGTPTNENNPPLSNITNNSSALIRSPQNMESISNQILGLTSICTRLQQEMSGLSRRSKDNATDLVSLREATHSRDEDIRKSLKDLVSNLTLKLPEGGTPLKPQMPHMLEERSASTPCVPKSFSLPRIPSPASFSASLERELANSPNSYSVDGAAAIALLEKILREMGTKETQEKLHGLMNEVSQNIKDGSNARTSKHLQDVIGLLKELKDQPSSTALVRSTAAYGDKPLQLDLNFEKSRGNQNVAQYNNSGNAMPYSSPRAADFVSEDILKLLKKMKDSISEGGGLSAEVKALVRELRGEVLGMGREIGRKLDLAESTQIADSRRDAHGLGREEISKIVEEGLQDLKEHMDHVMREHRRQSAASMASRTTVDSQEVYKAVKNALSEMPLPQPTIEHHGSGIEREDILEAVREAWETYKPEIDITTEGLEREELLECLTEGLKAYKPAEKERDLVIYDEVLDAVKKGLKDFKPPAPDTEASLTRDEILVTVRECLDSHEFPMPIVPTVHEPEITKEDVLEAVKEGLANQGPLTKEVDFNRDDLFEAVRDGLKDCPTPMAGVGEQVLEKIEELIDGMRGEFKQYSAANGRDTEQVLDAMKDGLEDLRSNVEGYVDRASDVTGKDEIIDTVRSGLDRLRIDLEASIANVSHPPAAAGSAELLDAMEREFEHLRSTISSSVTKSEVSQGGREEILDAIRDGFDEIQETSSKLGASADPGALSTVKEEIQHLRETLATTMTRSGGDFDKDEILDTIREGFGKANTTASNGTYDKEEIIGAVKEAIDHAQLGLTRETGRPESFVSNTSELIDHFNDGLEGLKADVERIVNKPVDSTLNEEILATLKEGLASVREDLDSLRSQQAVVEVSKTKRGAEVVLADEEVMNRVQKQDITSLEVMIQALQIKVDSLDDSMSSREPPPPPPPPPPAVSEDTAMKMDVERLESMMRELQDAVAALAAREQTQQENTVSKEDTDAIETLLRNTKAQIEELPFPDMENAAKKEHFEILETMLTNTKEAVVDLAAKQESDAVTKEELASLEVLIKEVQTNVQEVRDKSGEETALKADFEALANICSEHHTQFKDALTEGETLPTKHDVENLRDLVQEFKDKFDSDAEMTAQAFDARKTEHGGLADKIEEVKAFIESVRKELKDTVDGSGAGIQELATSLTVIGEAVTAANSGSTMVEVKEILDREFEKAHANHEANKADFEQHRDALVTKHDEHKAAVIEELTGKIDARFDELMTKYDDAQAAADAKSNTMEDTVREQAESITSAKAVTDDLKLLIDTLGSTVTESCERVGEDSKTVFTKVEEVSGKIDTAMDFLTIDGKADHQMTRGEVSKALAIVEGMQAENEAFNPKLMAAIEEVLKLVGTHYEEAQKTSEEIKSSVREIPSAIPVPALPALPEPVVEKEIPAVEKYDDTEVRSKLDKLVEQYDDTEVRSKLNKLVEHYESSEVGAKLDKLVEYTAETDKSAAQFEMLEEIKNQVTTTAAEFQTFMNAQQATIMNMQEVRSKEAEEAGIALEKRVAQKEAVEADVVRLSDERNDLEASVAELKREKDELASLRARLQADVSSLEMALEIRREEMQIMEERAEGLERRIVEGVLDHSRSLLLSSRPQSSLKAMNLKRVPSNASSNATVTTTKGSSVGANRKVPSAAASAVNSAVGMAMKKRQSGRPGEGLSPATSNRRILSLSTLGANKGQEKSMVIAKVVDKANSAFGGGLKRSHSVKSNFPSRKTSWGGTKQIGMFADDPEEEDKENSVLEEEDEDGSERGTDRRTSYTGTYTGTEMSYGTESVTDSNDDRRTSYAASVIGTVDGEQPHEVDDVDQSEQGDNAEGSHGDGGEMELYQGDVVHTRDFGDGTKEVIVYGMPSDSGIGSDLPTAALSAGGEYFDRD